MLHKTQHNLMLASIMARLSLAFIVFTSCIASGSQTSKTDFLTEEPQLFPTFYYTHYHSQSILTFEQSNLYIQNIYKGPNAGESKVTSKELLANWNISNDSIITLTNIEIKKNSPLRNVTKFYIIDSSLEITDLLVPDNSFQLYMDSLKNELIQTINNNPFVPDNDDLELIKADSSYLDKLKTYHNRSILSEFTSNHYEQGFYYGKWN